MFERPDGLEIPRPCLPHTISPAPNENAALYSVLNDIGDKWVVQIVTRLSGGARRFNELRRDIPALTQQVLATKLMAMRRCGFVTRTRTSARSPAVVYALTELGRSLCEPAAALEIWARQHEAAIGAARLAYHERFHQTDPA